MSMMHSDADASTVHSAVCSLRPALAGDLVAHERSVHGAQVLRCGASGCLFECTHHADALRHLSETHGDFLVHYYDQATRAGAFHFQFQFLFQSSTVASASASRTLAQ